MDTISVEQIAEAVEHELERLKRARPALSSRIERAENILVTHLSCPKAGIVRPRIRGGELVAYLVKGSGGAVYRVDPASWQCSCPDAHRRGKGCKHAILCWALWRAYRPAVAPELRGRRRRCDAKPKIVRHDTGLAVRESRPSSSYEERECVRCFAGLVYEEGEGWVPCRTCFGSGRAPAFVYEGRSRRLRGCAGCGGRFEGRNLIELDEDNHDDLTYFHGDLLCRECAAAHGVL